jgi:hypothetical protein
MPDLTAEDLRAAHRPPDEPAGTKEPITAEEPDAARQAEDRKPGERAPREDAVPDRHAANETAEPPFAGPPPSYLNSPRIVLLPRGSGSELVAR